MLNVEYYQNEFQVGDLIHYAKGWKESYQREDIGYIFKIEGDDIHIKWFRDAVPTCESIKSIKGMPRTYIFPVIKL